MRLLAPLRAHMLPSSWLAEPPPSAPPPAWGQLHGRLWRNQHKIFDVLTSLEAEYPHGQPRGMGMAGRLDLPEACRELTRELLPQNMRWCAIPARSPHRVEMPEHLSLIHI